jgi:large subunit ribosomal protein L22
MPEPTTREKRGAETYTASHRFARISARKARLVMDLIRGDPVELALTKLGFSSRRAAPLIRKVVQSALANATQKSGLAAQELYVYRAFVDGGPTMKRWRPRSMGRAFPRMRRTSHFTVVLSRVADVRTASSSGRTRVRRPRGSDASGGGTSETGAPSREGSGAEGRDASGGGN